MKLKDIFSDFHMLIILLSDSLELLQKQSDIKVNILDYNEGQISRDSMKDFRPIII